jgi:hypothetical protein
MIWVTWRQFRGQAVAASLIVAVVVVTLGITGIHLEHLYTTYKQNITTCNPLSCNSVRSRLLDSYQHVRLFGTLLIGVPALIGLFWGAPLVARELDGGTFRLAWTQSVTRTRWMLSKLAFVGAASMVAAGIFSLVMTWWARPYDQVNANHLSPALFDQRGIAPIAYAGFAFALGVAVGLLVKRTVPAMAITLVGFIATRMAIQYLVRPHLFSPLHRVFPLSPSTGVGLNLRNSQLTIDAGHPNLHGGWITSTRIVDASGNAPTSNFLHQACSAALNVPPPSVQGVRKHAPAEAQRAFTSCIHNVGARFHELVAYQPNSRFWEFQWTEAGMFLGLTILLSVACVALVRRRLA